MAEHTSYSEYAMVRHRRDRQLAIIRSAENQSDTPQFFLRCGIFTEQMVVALVAAPAKKILLKLKKANRFL
jgi:hypothetical protein